MDLFSVEDRNGKWSDTTASAAFSAGEDVEERSSCSAKPLICLAKERRLRR